ncbi:hypothetical protein BC826DRAFT_529302 [Russula brevipes]|nr:hypothetical protein BC826DRAFT_529302 [Russula brevipes]
MRRQTATIPIAPGPCVDTRNSLRTTRNEVGGNLSGDNGEPDTTPPSKTRVKEYPSSSPRSPQAARTRAPDVVGRVSSLPPSVAMEHVNELAYISGMRLMTGWCHCPTYPDILCRDSDTFCTNALLIVRGNFQKFLIEVMNKPLATQEHSLCSLTG